MKRNWVAFMIVNISDFEKEMVNCICMPEI